MQYKIVVLEVSNLDAHRGGIAIARTDVVSN